MTNPNPTKPFSREMLTDPDPLCRRSSETPPLRQRLASKGFDSMAEVRVRSMIPMNPPDHTRLRGLVNIFIEGRRLAMEYFTSRANSWLALCRHIPAFIFAVGLLCLTACFPHTTYPLIKATAPKVNFFHTTEVDSMQPVFRWSPSKTVAPDTRYDLIVYEAIYNNREAGNWNDPEFSRGPVVYYREGLSGTEHRMEIPIKLRVVVGRQYNGMFIWSVRTRRGTEVSDWAGYDQRLTIIGGPGLTGSSKVTNQPFRFSVRKAAGKK